MKILHITPTYFPSWSFGGITRVSYEVTKELSKRGHYVEVWTSDAFDRYSRVSNNYNNVEINGIKVKYFKNLSFTLTRKFYDLLFTPSLIKFAYREVNRFDIIHLHGVRTFQSLATYPFLKRNRVSYIVQAHGLLWKVSIKEIMHYTLYHFYNKTFAKKLLEDASRAIALSRVEFNQYRSMGIPKEKIAIIPNGINLSKYAELPPKDSFRKKFNIPEDKKIILYLGRIHKTKGIDFLVRAYAYLKNEINFRNAILVIAGPNDGYLSEIKSLVQYLDISNSVLFMGLLSEKDKMGAYVDSDVVVNVEPSNVYGLVPLEAAACSTPVIVSKTNAISEVIIDGKFGFSVRYGDVISLAFMLQRILNDEKLAKKLGENGRKHIFDHLGWSRIIERYEQVYDEVLTTKL